MNDRRIIVAQMTEKKYPTWSYEQKHISNRLLRNTAFFAAGSLCLCLCTVFAVNKPQETAAVMSHLTAEFEYDESLGRLQLVSNLLPESAMVFLNTNEQDIGFISPVHSAASHTWTQQEPWIEYTEAGEITACQAGEIMTIVKNHAGTHTVRILHDNGYESIYSGLQEVLAHEHDPVYSGQVIGTTHGRTSFELRKDGISILPVFSEI